MRLSLEEPAGMASANTGEIKAAITAAKQNLCSIFILVCLSIMAWFQGQRGN